MARLGRANWLQWRHPGSRPAPKARPQPREFQWPDGRAAALSLTFDDGRASQLVHAAPTLDRLGVKGTFFLVPGPVGSNWQAWRRVVANGHEIGNHTVHHPCEAGIPGVRSHVLEDMTLDDMRAELVDANSRIGGLLGVIPKTFAYPYGQSTVGRGQGARSYVPLVAELFDVGRTFNDRWANDPGRCDLSKVACVDMDGQDFDGVRMTLEAALTSGAWTVLGGHEVDPTDHRATSVELLKRIAGWCEDHRVWVDTLGSVGAWVGSFRASCDGEPATVERMAVAAAPQGRS